MRFLGRRTRSLHQDHSNEHRCIPNAAGYCPCPLAEKPEAEADLVCSDLDREGWHLPVFDLDMACELVPSGTPGHFHLYIDQPVKWDAYVAVIKAMCEAGLIQWQWLDTTRERGYASVRHPDRPKKESK